jgi:hypothetical protein
MPSPVIPSREPIGDSFAGDVLTVDGHYLLAPSPIEGYEALHQGMFIVRYGVVYLGKPHYSIVPSLLALDYGNFLTGEEAWNFLLNKSNLHPRADVLGYRNDGLDEQVFIKQLDLMWDFDILIYADENATKPLAKVAALITKTRANLPARLVEYTPIFPSIEVWQKASS